MDAEDDETLVRRMRQGDRAAFETLVRRHQDRLWRLAGAMLRVPDHASDATQEVFLRAWTGLPRFRFRSSVFTWLYATLRNVCREYNRRARPTGTLTDELVDAAPTPEQRADVNQRLGRLVAGLRTLPVGQQDVFLLRIMEGLSVEESARALRCSQGTIKTQLHRALRRLRAIEAEEHR